MNKIIATMVVLCGLAAVAVPVAHACQQWSCTTNIFGQTCTCTRP
jgi:hypothetical protein